MTFAQRRNRVTTHFSERIPVVKRRISVYVFCEAVLFNATKPVVSRMRGSHADIWTVMCRR